MNKVNKLQYRGRLHGRIRVLYRQTNTQPRCHLLFKYSMEPSRANTHTTWPFDRSVGAKLDGRPIHSVDPYGHKWVVTALDAAAAVEVQSQVG
jgi:hypothetical protein